MTEMFHLILLRHAHAEPARADVADLDRGLSRQGEAEADTAARWLAQHARPQRAVTSAARRARQTLERVLTVTGYTDVREDARIYDATPGDLIEVIEAHREAGDLLLVGHNPGLETLVALLATGRSAEHRGMPPAGIAVLSLERGQAIDPGAAKLAAFWSP
jgi:phosphohistidine phosphatase SixA